MMSKHQNELSNKIICQLIKLYFLQFTLTLFLNNKCEEKRKKRNEKGGEGKEEKRNEKKVIVVCLEKEGKGNKDYSLKIFLTLN